MAAQNYRNRTLVGNWWEDRHLGEDLRAPPVSRDEEEGLPAPRIARRPQKSTARTIFQTEGSFYDTESRSQLRDPRVHPQMNKKREPVITHKNFNRALEPRPLNRPARGFGAALPRDTNHGPGRPQIPSERFQTTAAASFVDPTGTMRGSPAKGAAPVFPKEEARPAGAAPGGARDEKEVFPFVTLKGVADVDRQDFRRKTGFTKPCDGVWQDAESIVN